MTDPITPKKPPSPIPIPLPSQPQPLQNQNPLHHISFGVHSYSVSKPFYTAVLSALGLHLVFDSEDPSNPATASFKENHIRTLGYGPDKDIEIINLFEVPGPEALEETQPPGRGLAGFHLALTAPTRLAVVEFHAAAVQNGGMDNGLPGVREEYGENYFAAYVVDPDGYRLEVVCKRRLDDLEEDGKGEEEKGRGEGKGEKGGKEEVKREEIERMEVEAEGNAEVDGIKHLVSVGEGTVRLQVG